MYNYSGTNKIVEQDLISFHELSFATPSSPGPEASLKSVLMPSSFAKPLSLDLSTNTEIPCGVGQGGGQGKG